MQPFIVPENFSDPATPQICVSFQSLPGVEIWIDHRTIVDSIDDAAAKIIVHFCSKRSKYTICERND